MASYDRLVADPQSEIERICAFAGLSWDRQLAAPLPLSRHTLTSPEPEKWRHNGEELKPAMPLADLPLADHGTTGDEDEPQPASRPRSSSNGGAAAHASRPGHDAE